MKQQGFGVIDAYSYFLLVIDASHVTLYDVFDCTIHGGGWRWLRC